MQILEVLCLEPRSLPLGQRATPTLEAVSLGLVTIHLPSELVLDPGVDLAATTTPVDLYLVEETHLAALGATRVPPCLEAGAAQDLAVRLAVSGVALEQR